MSQTLEMKEEDYKRYLDAIHHFRGYIDKVRLEDDIEYLIQFVQKMVDRLNDEEK